MADLRKLAAEVMGRAALEERFAPRQLSAVDAILMQKQASTDPALIKVAATIAPDAVLSTYEKLGGGYETKEAVSSKWVREAVSSAKATPTRLERFIDKVQETHGSAWGKTPTRDYHRRNLVREEAVRAATKHPGSK